MNRLKYGSIAVGAEGSEARRKAEMEDLDREFYRLEALKAKLIAESNKGEEISAILTLMQTVSAGERGGI